MPKEILLVILSVIAGVIIGFLWTTNKTRRKRKNNPKPIAEPISASEQIRRQNEIIDAERLDFERLFKQEQLCKETIIEAFKKLRWPSEFPIIIPGFDTFHAEWWFNKELRVTSFLSGFFDDVEALASQEGVTLRLAGAKETINAGFESLIHPEHVPFDLKFNGIEKPLNLGKDIDFYPRKVGRCLRLSPKGIVTSTFKRSKQSTVKVFEVWLDFGHDQIGAERWLELLRSRLGTIVEKDGHYYLKVAFYENSCRTEITDSVLTWPMQTEVMLGALDAIRDLEAKLEPGENPIIDCFRSQLYFNIVISYRCRIIVISDSRAYFNSFKGVKGDNTPSVIDYLVACKDLKQIAANHYYMETLAGSVDWFCNSLPFDTKTL